MHEHESEEVGYSRSHLLIMALCCLIPIVLLVVVASIAIERTYVLFLLVLLCPLMMFLMFLPRILSRKKRI